MVKKVVTLQQFGDFFFVYFPKIWRARAAPRQLKRFEFLELKRDSAIRVRALMALAAYSLHCARFAPTLAASKKTAYFDSGGCSGTWLRALIAEA